MISEKMTSKKWNDKYKEGISVRYYPIRDGKKYYIGKTRSAAWDICGTPCVLISSRAGGVALSHLVIIENKCTWHKEDPYNDNEDATWGTSCGKSFTLNDGTPKEGGMRYCCFCGKKIKQKSK